MPDHAVATEHEISSEEIEYLRHGDRPLMMQIVRPRGDGRFPVVLDLHGGAWTKGGRAECRARDEVLARRGIVAVAPDFRQGEDGYPTSLADINYAIRWVKANAQRLGTRADLVGICGQSSGGQLAMLAAMRPNDPRYHELPLPKGSIPVTGAIDATVLCVAMTWPVINPLSRYRHAKRLAEGANPPAWTRGMPERHDVFWKNEAAMEEGNPMLALERGEKVLTPPALWVQGRPDEIHDYHDPGCGFAGNEPERFVSNYRHAGGEIELLYIDQAERTGPASHEPIAAFFHKHLR